MSEIKYLFDENLDPRYKATLMRRQPAIDAIQIGEPGAPPRGTKDPEILSYLESERRILVTNNRDSMPDHLEDHRVKGGTNWGIFSLKPNTTFIRLAEELELIWGTTEAEEWLNMLIWVPAFT